MKTKDLIMGEAYAFAAPNSYDAKNPLKVTAIKAGVYGPSPRSGYGTRSSYPNFIEFEVPEGRLPSQHTVNLNAEGKIKNWRSDEETVATVARGPAANFLMPWAEWEAKAKDLKETRERLAKDKQIQREFRAGLIERLQKFGVGPISDYDRDVRISLADVEKLLEHLE